MFTNRLKTQLTAFAVASLLALPAAAHHGWSTYRQDVDVTVTVTKIAFGFPHDRIEGTDADGNRWNFLLAPPDRNEDFGYGAELFTVGDTVEVIGQRMPGRTEAKVHFVNTPDGTNLYTYYYGQPGRATTSFDRNH